MAPRIVYPAVVAAVLLGTTTGSAQRITPPAFQPVASAASAPDWRSAERPESLARPRVLTVARSGPPDGALARTWPTLRSVVYLELGIAALASLAYGDEDDVRGGGEAQGGILLFSAWMLYDLFTSGPCASSTPGIFTIMPLGLALVGGYDVFLAKNRKPTANELFQANEIGLNVVAVASWFLTRPAARRAPPCIKP